ncbi:MAG: carboxypeptidase-like regulatory domain-containing protein [Halobacteriales archaeon]|nr:carboxypeptidase-like regulatory domain-containing protein [Halobacteriales archaeon]
MHQRTALLTAVVVLLAAVGPFAGLAAAEATLTVTVTTAAGGALGNADLTATVDGEVVDTATTASNGKAFLDVPEGADVTIEVDHNVYLRNSPFTVTDAGEQEVSITVWEEATATVTVSDSSGPVEDARVVFRKNGEIVTVKTTDASGEVATGRIESGDYSLSFTKTGYYDKAVTLAVEDDTTAEFTIERGSVTVRFQVLDDNFDPAQPIGEATISGETIGTVNTLPDGTREVSVPVNTRLRVTVEKDEYEAVAETVLVRETKRVVNLTTRKQPAVSVELSNERVVVGETVEVTVTDEYGQPLSGATVVLDGTEVGQPDADGTLRVAIESAGNHTLFASADGLISERLTVVGVDPGAEGSPANEGTAATEPVDDGGDQELMIGDLNLRSTAIGVAGGLVLAVVLFVVLRFR